jgi:hypothetical protein
MKTLPYIEDYISLMAIDSINWPPREPLIKLARYDEPIVNSMAQQIQNNLGFTDKQANLAHKIVIKYRRQWASQNYDVSAHVDVPKYRNSIRNIDRSKIIGLDKNIIYLRFPYDQNLINDLRTSVQSVNGSLVFNKEKRQWEAGLIEPRLIWAKEFGLKHQFTFNPEFDQVFEIMFDHEEYEIKLVKLDQDSYHILNGANSLIDYIDQHGGFGVNNLCSLVDMSSLLGYKIDTTILDEFKKTVEPELHDYFLNKYQNITFQNCAQIIVDDLIRYAKCTNRFPIFIYEADNRILFNLFKEKVGTINIVDKESSMNQLWNSPIIYIKYWKLIPYRIPLLVTNTSLIGFRRQQMLQCADKVVYFIQDINNAAMPTTNT